MYSGEYQLVGSEMSFFTRKLEAQLRFQQVPWRYLFKTEDRKEKYYECDYGFGTTRARSQKRLNLARLHVQNELLRAGAADDPGVQDLFAGRGILEHYLN